MFTTKSIVELRDCSNKIIFSSKEGKSKDKEYKKAYHEAIRNAFKSIQSLKYKYIPVKDTVIENKEKMLLLLMNLKLLRLKKQSLLKK